MLSLTLREMRAHARRLTGTSLAVLLGVAFLTGTLVLGDTLRRNFDDLFAEVNAGTDVVVRASTDLGLDAPDGRIPAALADDVAQVDGVAEAVPVVTGYAQLLGADGDAIGGNGPPQLGVAQVAPQPLGHRGRRREHVLGPPAGLDHHLPGPHHQHQRRHLRPRRAPEAPGERIAWRSSQLEGVEAGELGVELVARAERVALGLSGGHAGRPPRAGGP